MTVGRFAVDRVAARVGPVWVLRGGALVAAAGYGCVIVSTGLPLVLVGWCLLGLGLAGGVPQVFTAAGNLGGMSGRTLSRVVGVGYLAILSGPAIIGWLVELISWRGAFLVPLCAVLICAAAARAVAPRKETSA
jgi:MFS family permease